jgi:hypothetical protein
VGLSATNAVAGPKYRAFQHSKPKKVQTNEIQRVAAASQFHGEVSDSPPVSIDGQISSIGSRNISTPVLNKSQKPAPAEVVIIPDTERHYQVQTHSLRQGLARMATLYGNLRKNP